MKIKVGTTIRRRGLRRSEQPGMAGIVTRVYERGIGWGDPGPSYSVRWASGYESRVRGRDVEVERRRT